MDSIYIEGGHKLIGAVNISGSKNESLPLMVLSLLTDKKLTLQNIPSLSDIKTMKSLLLHLGTEIEEKIKPDNGLELALETRSLKTNTAPYEIVSKMRASIWVLGPLLAKFGEAKVSIPGGCAIGARQINLHIDVLKAMGAEFEVEEGYIYGKVSGKLKGCNFVFTQKSVGATITGILAASLAEGRVVLSNCAQEPEIINLCNCLNKMSADIKGIGSTELVINGKKSLAGTTFKVESDRIEAGTYMIAAAATKGDLSIKNIKPQIVESLIMKLKEAGIIVKTTKNSVRVIYDGKLKATNISTEPYPGFPTDLQAQFMCLMTIAEGTSIITENIFENRFMHAPELNRMGANVTIKGKSAIIHGTPSLSGASVMASDLRASVSLVIAGLCAKGNTTVNRVYHLDRGYQDIEKKLVECGAKIKRLSS